MILTIKRAVTFLVFVIVMQYFLRQEMSFLNIILMNLRLQRDKMALVLYESENILKQHLKQC
jgi:hypothetical protein